MRSLFSNSDATTVSNDGIATRLRRMADQAMGIDGTISTRTQGLQRSIERNNDRQESLNDQIARVEKRLRLQYSALDTQLGQLNGLQNYINQQFNNNNNNNSG
jgi:flagellar hook-associated protein 2